MKKLLIVILIITLFGFKPQTSSELPASVTVSKEELKLYNKIMTYRKLRGLPKIPLSKSLTYVAQTHCLDLYKNKPHKEKQCNLHSWSTSDEWSSCCYTKNHKNASCMWNKPLELTNYKGDGYEISAGPSKIKNADYPIDAKQALSGWKNSEGHNNVILNKKIWKDRKWEAIGVGIYKGYACVWFGSMPDKFGEPQK